MTEETPKLFYRHHVFCCVNERSPDNPRGCCAAKDAEKLRNYMKDRCKQLGLKDVRINSSGCLDRCEHGPVMVIYPEGVWFRCATKEDIDEVIEEYLGKGKKIEHLLIA